MKLSNHIVEINNYPVEGVSLWYSTATDNATIVSNELKDLVGKPDAEIADEPRIKKLIEQKFILPNEFDEDKLTTYIFNSGKYSTKNLGVTIAPTMKCNFNCIYCFEDENTKKKDMDIDTANKILTWLEKMLESSGVRKLETQYFGGEPTQNIDIVKYLANAIAQLTQRNHVELKNYIITNGYFDNDLIFTLVDLKINNIQFTIDGDEETHNKRKALCSGLPTFDVVYKNFIEVVNRTAEFNEIMLRINIDETNVNNVIPLLERIKKDVDLKKITVDINETSWAHKKPEDYDEIRNWVVELTKKAIELGFNYDFHLGHFESCNFSKQNNIAIGPDGMVYKCILMIEEEAFRVSPIESYNNSLSMIDFVEEKIDPECIKCKYGPMCFGGCRASAYKRLGDKKKKICKKSFFDRYMEPHLKLFYGSIIENKLVK
jgi:uncharacterized protein